MARGQGGSLFLPCTTLSFATPCRFYPGAIQTESLRHVGAVSLFLRGSLALPLAHLQLHRARHRVHVGVDVLFMRGLRLCRLPIWRMGPRQLSISSRLAIGVTGECRGSIIPFTVGQPVQATSPRSFAHLALCAIAIFCIEAAENLLCLRAGGSTVAAGSVGPPVSTARSSAILVSMCRLCS